MNRYFKAFICILVAVSFASCGKERVDIEDYEQIFDVQQFEAQLNSITPLDNSTYIVGGKTGDLFKVRNSIVSDHYATSSDCIYTAFVDSNGDWWIGTRNDGLHHWDGDKPDMGTPNRKYTIPKKDTGYSVYNILPLRKDSILVGTSNGLYCVTLNGSDSLSPLYCRLDTTTRKPEPVEFRIPVVLQDSIFYPSQDGIYFVGMNNRKMWLDKDKNFKAICLSPDSMHLYALSAGSKGNNDLLWIIDVKNMKECSPPIELPFSADHLLQVHSKVYLLSRSYLYTTLADDLNERDPHFSRVPLKRRLPENTKSGFIYDRNADCIRIITERAVLTFPARNGMANRSGIMKLGCVDTSDNVFYFINLQNELFKYDPRSDSLLAQKVLDLETSTADVTALHVDKETVYYEINHSSLKKLSISGKQKYGLWWNQPKRIQIPEHPKSTALLIDGDSAVYVGFKDNILRYSLVAPDTDVLSNSHPTSLQRVNNAVVATTLNDGLLFDNHLTICPHIRFQEAYCVSDSLSLLLSNHFLYLLKDTTAVDSVALKGYKRIFVSPNGRMGVAVSTDSLQWFSYTLQDSIILGKATSSNHILINGCVQKGDTLFVSTEAGVEIVDMKQDTADTEMTSTYLSFSKDKFKSQERNRRTIVWVVIVLIVITIFVGFCFNWRKIIEKVKRIESECNNLAQKLTEANDNIKNLERERDNLVHKLTDANDNIEVVQNQIQLLQDEVKRAQSKLRGNYQKRIDVLQQYSEYLSEERIQILATLVKKLHETDEGLSADSDELNIKILELEFVLPLILNAILKGQLSDMKHENKWDKRRDNIRKIIDGLDLKEKVRCIKENKKELDSSEEQQHKEKEWLKSYDYAFVKMRLKGEKPGLPHAIKEGGETNNPHKKPTVEEKKQALENLATAEGRAMVEQYIKRQENKIEAAILKIDADTELASILEAIKEEYHKLDLGTLDDNINISVIQEFIQKRLFILHTRLNVVSEICEIHNLLINFQTKYKEYNRIKSYYRQKDKIPQDDKQSQKEAEEQLKIIVKSVKCLCDYMTDCCDKEGLLDPMGLKLSKFKNDESMALNSTALAISMADYNNIIPYSWLCSFGLITGTGAETTYTKRMNEIRKKINTKKEFLVDYTEVNPTSIGALLLKIGSDNRRKS